MTTSTDHATTAGVRRFPQGFLWGAATAAYQVEGAVAEDGRLPSVWDTFSHTPGKVRGDDNGDVACNSYNLVDTDLDLISGLGLGAHRFSVSWSRILPTGSGPVEQRGLDHYRRFVDGLRARGIRPALTLFHWDLPQALEDVGGWTVRDTAYRMAEYAAIVATALGDAVDLWITTNEPGVVAHQGYGIGTHAPGRIDPPAAAAAAHHLVLGHGLALEALRSILPGAASIGISLDIHPVRAAGPGAEEALARHDAEQNRLCLDPVLHGRYPAAASPQWLPPDHLIKSGDLALISAPIDFVGVNYYGPHYVRLGDWDDLRLGETPLKGFPGAVTYVPPELPRTSMGWAVDPSGLYDVLTELSLEAPGLALYVTENGCAAEDYVNPAGEIDDIERVDYLRGHLEAAWRAARDGANLAGYFVWSLMDNFEWAWGYQKRFGLVYVDFASGQRIPKASGRLYSQIAQANALPAEPAQPG
jgi:beta-glucosidase